MLQSPPVSDERELLRVEPLLAEGIPLVVSPRQAGATLAAAREAIRSSTERHLTEAGALLFRGFGAGSVEAFRQFARSFGSPLLDYEFGSTPRSQVMDGVHSSTEYPAHQSIPLHNEQSYSTRWPLKIWFYCAVAPAARGETPIADSRLVYSRIDPALRARFEARRLMYVRNFGNGLDVPWSQVFGTEDPSAVERYCRANAIAWEWKDDGELRTRQVCQASARHPRTGATVWFNQAHLFHISGLEPSVREALCEVVPVEDLPRNVYYGDGAPLEESALDEVRGVLDECKVEFAWREGDVLMLDNMLVAHARNPFSGPRRIVVAMAEPYSAAAEPGAALP